jgi:hypothetical protein
MVLVMKLTTFAWNVWDGRRPVEVCTLSSAFDRMGNLTQHAYVGSRQVADENAGFQIPFIARILRLLVRRSLPLRLVAH